MGGVWSPCSSHERHDDSLQGGKRIYTFFIGFVLLFFAASAFSRLRWLLKVQHPERNTNRPSCQNRGCTPIESMIHVTSMATGCWVQNLETKVNAHTHAYTVPHRISRLKAIIGRLEALANCCVYIAPILVPAYSEATNFTILACPLNTQGMPCKF